MYGCVGIGRYANYFKPEWFASRQTQGTEETQKYVRPEYREAFEQAKTKAQKAARREYHSTVLEWENSDTHNALNEEQIRDLADKYDVSHMSEKEFSSFVDELCGLGVLDEEDKDYLPLVSSQYEALTKVNVIFGAPVGYLVGSGSSCPPMMSSLSATSGDAVKWSRYMASYQAYDPQTQSFFHDRPAVLFGRLADVMEQMKKV